MRPPGLLRESGQQEVLPVTVIFTAQVVLCRARQGSASLVRIRLRIQASGVRASPA